MERSWLSASAITLVVSIVTLFVIAGLAHTDQSVALSRRRSGERHERESTSETLTV